MDMRLRLYTISYVKDGKPQFKVYFEAVDDEAAKLCAHTTVCLWRMCHVSGEYELECTPNTVVDKGVV